MKVLDLSLPTPAENLALDEALLDACESGPGEKILRFWEPHDYFVVVGYANKVDLEVNRPACENAKIPILRRCSGGGTVLQGPGCLNYTVVLKIDDNPELATIPQTNNFVMNRQKVAVEEALSAAGIRGNESTPAIRGHTDLALGNLKFSGNAQRRKRHALIFHGTFLLDFDLGQVARFLRLPSKEPDYRQGRSHLDFLTNLQLPAALLKEKLQQTWSADAVPGEIPSISHLMQERYLRADWHLKF